jgi:hypothetical protein
MTSRKNFAFMGKKPPGRSEKDLLRRKTIFSIFFSLSHWSILFRVCFSSPGGLSNINKSGHHSKGHNSTIDIMDSAFFPSTKKCLVKCDDCVKSKGQSSAWHEFEKKEHRHNRIGINSMTHNAFRLHYGMMEEQIDSGRPLNFESFVGWIWTEKNSCSKCCDYSLTVEDISFEGAEFEKRLLATFPALQPLAAILWNHALMFQTLHYNRYKLEQRVKDLEAFDKMNTKVTDRLADELKMMKRKYEGVPIYPANKKPRTEPRVITSLKPEGITVDILF